MGTEKENGPAWRRYGQVLTGLVGLRTLKTGLAVALATWVVHYVPYSLPLLAGVAAVICMQPTIAGGVAKGVTRTQATILGGALGLALYFVSGSNVLAMGLGVVFIIMVCNRLGWEDGIALASLSLIAVMLQPAGAAVPYALGRVTSTVAGIAAATGVNAVVAPPRHRPVLQGELRRLLGLFPPLYTRAVDAYAANDMKEVEGVEEELRTIREEMQVLETEVEYLQVCVETPYGSWLEGIALSEYLLARQGVSVLREILDKVEDITRVARARQRRRQELMSRGGGAVEEIAYTPEFLHLIQALEQMARELGEMHREVFRWLGGGGGQELVREIGKRGRQLRRHQEEVRERLKSWEAEYIDRMDFQFLMSANRIVFDLEEIAGALEGLALPGAGKDTCPEGDAV